EFPEEFSRKYLRSLQMQMEFLSDNLELDILGNHLVKNWKALIFGGTFFNEPRYLRRAGKIEKDWIMTQFTEDGLHHEMSPMYTGIVLEDFVEVYLLKPEANIKEQIGKTALALSSLVNGNQYLFFNDSVNNNEVSVADLDRLLREAVKTGISSPA